MKVLKILEFKLIMLQISIIKKSDIQKARRLDAEFFRPEYLEIDRKIINHQWNYLEDISEDILTGKTPQYEKDAKTLVVRSGDLRKNLIDIDQLLKTNETDLFYLNRNDVLISSIGKGSIGKIAINYEKERIATVSEVSVIRNVKIDSAFLNIFLLSYFGQAQIEKFITGATGQLHLLPSNIKKIKIPILSQSFQLQIEKIVKSAYQKQTRSKQLYKEAENLFLEELGLKDFQGKDDLFNIVNLSEIKEANRIDAEYFQVKYDKLIEKIKKHKAKKLSDLISIKKGIEPGSEEYQNDGKPFIRVSNLSKFGINNNNQKYLSDELYQKLKKDYQPQVGEILLTKDATPGIAWAVKKSIEGIISGGILRLKIKSEIEPEYLSLILDSVIGQMQTERDTGGSIIIHWRPEQIKNCLIPILPKPTQQKIADLIRASHQTRKEAKENLEKAKRKVEEEIEK